MQLKTTLLLAFVAFTTSTLASLTTTTYDPTATDAPVLLSHPRGRPSCAKGVHIIAVSGIGSNDAHAYGILKETVKGIHGAIPDSNNDTISYPKKSLNYASSTATGQRNLVKNIAWYARGCPKTPIVLLGYSAGGMITANTLCGRSHGAPPARLPMNYMKNIIAAITLGDETFVPGQPWSRGTCKRGRGVSARRNSSQCMPWAQVFRQYCDIGDAHCCVGQGSGNEAHYTYTQRYDHQFVAFVVEKWKARKHQG